MFLHRDHSLNLNEVNYVSVTALHVNALFIAGYKRSLPPGFLGRGNENASLKKICYKKKSVRWIPAPRLQAKTYGKINRNIVQNRFCHQLLCFKTGFKKGITSGTVKTDLSWRSDKTSSNRARKEKLFQKWFKKKLVAMVKITTETIQNLFKAYKRDRKLSKG